MRISFENGEHYDVDYYSDPYMIAFLENYILKESCYECKFKDKNYKSDLTLGDFWEYEKYYPKVDDYGVSAIIAHSKIGKDLIKHFESSGVAVQANMDIFIKGNYSYQKPVERKRREKLYKKVSAHMPNWFNASKYIIYGDALLTILTTKVHRIFSKANDEKQ